jgi:hypothetical protein
MWKWRGVDQFLPESMFMGHTVVLLLSVASIEGWGLASAFICFGGVLGAGLEP